jgi:predicted ATPase
VASHYLRLGVSLLATNSWKVEYELTLELYSAAAEVEYCIGNLEHVVKLNTAIVANSRRIADTIRAHSIHVYSLGSRGHMLKAIERGLKVLDGLGEKFPTKQSINSIAVAIKRTKWMIANRSNEDFLCLPMMDDPDKLASMQIMNVMFLYAYMALPTLAPLIATRMVKLTLECGLCDISSVGFVTYGMLLCGIGNDINEGFRLGELAMKVFNKFETKPWIGRIVAWYYGSICIWKKPNVTIFEPIKTAHKIALELGDVEFAMLNANTYCWESFDLSTLSKVEKVVSGFSRRLEAYGQDSVVAMIKPLWQTVHNFKGRAYGDPKKLTGEIMEQEYMVQYARENNKTLLVWCHFYCLLLCYVFEDMEAAEAHATVCRVAQSNPFASPDRVLLTFYDGLVALGHPGRLTWSRQKAARRSIKQFKVWSKHCPENFLGKLYFLEAEMAAAMGDSIRAHSKYASAVSLAREGGYIFQHALVNERAGKFFFRNGDKELAMGYLQEALAAYGVWGGRRCVKVELLEEEISRIVMI